MNFRFVSSNSKAKSEKNFWNTASYQHHPRHITYESSLVPKGTWQRCRCFRDALTSFEKRVFLWGKNWSDDIARDPVLIFGKRDLLGTGLRNRTLEQTEFPSLAVYCWIPVVGEGRRKRGWLAALFNMMQAKIVLRPLGKWEKKGWFKWQLRQPKRKTQGIVYWVLLLYCSG